MQTVRIVVWQDADMWLGYLDEYPDYRTQGSTLAELKDNLQDLHRDLSGGLIPAARHVEEMTIS